MLLSRLSCPRDGLHLLGMAFADSILKNILGLQQLVFRAKSRFDGPLDFGLHLGLLCGKLCYHSLQFFYLSRAQFCVYVWFVGFSWWHIGIIPRSFRNSCRKIEESFANIPKYRWEIPI